MENLKGLLGIGLLFGSPFIGSLLLGLFNGLNGFAQMIILFFAGITIFAILLKIERKNS